MHQFKYCIQSKDNEGCFFKFITHAGLPSSCVQHFIPSTSVSIAQTMADTNMDKISEGVKVPKSYKVIRIQFVEGEEKC